MSLRLISRVASHVAARASCVPAAQKVIAQPFFVQGSRQFSHSLGLFNQQKSKVSEVLQSEIELETSQQVVELTEDLSTFLSKYGYKEVVNAGKNMAQIQKDTDEETVNVFFDVAQVANLPVEPAALEQGEEQMDEDYDTMSDNFANVNVVVVKKADQSALSFELLMNMQEGSFYVDSVTPHASAEAALDESAEAEVSRELVYHGPPFSNLDESLQETLEVYLESRGVTADLASFISGYSEFKENNEYIQWLNKLNKFFN